MKKVLSRMHRRARSWRAEKRMDKRTRMLFDAWVSEKGYLKKESMAEAADDMGMSSYQLKYWFFRNMPKPFLVWRKEMRIVEAVRIMEAEPGKKLESVAADVGIADIRDFRRQFGETLGISLSEWRKNLLKTKKRGKFAGV